MKRVREREKAAAEEMEAQTRRIAAVKAAAEKAATAIEELVQGKFDEA